MHFSNCYKKGKKEKEREGGGGREEGKKIERKEKEAILEKLPFCTLQ